MVFMRALRGPAGGATRGEVAPYTAEARPSIVPIGSMDPIACMPRARRSVADAGEVCDAAHSARHFLSLFFVFVSVLFSLHRAQGFRA